MEHRRQHRSASTAPALPANRPATSRVVGLRPTSILATHLQGICHPLIANENTT
ncbi:hypothetical protein [Corynebacterium glyciniphilum]|uniref:hypothetical protein n=1 Tax=Corynebacterium glyciniphilum TaxID=1404244 RepID=UPI000A81DAA8|nr:hypothetical protein [Corynebacterium glyciniphilum]